MIIGVTYWAVPNMLPWVWTYVLLMGLSIVAHFYIPESPYWLYKQRRLDEFWDVISLMAASNRKEINLEQLKED